MGSSYDDVAMIRARLIHLSDGYLNTPDKMTNETPLHFASKFLAVDAVEVLVSHPLTDKNVRNIYKELPADVSFLKTFNKLLFLCLIINRYLIYYTDYWTTGK